MLLSPQDVARFFKLHWALMFFVNQRLQVIADNLGAPEDFSALSAEVRLKVHQAFLKHPGLIQTFVDENPARLSDQDLAIVRSWQHLVPGKFYIFRALKKYTVFLKAAEQPVAYGVLALSQPFEELVGPYLPILTDTILLPYKDVIVYDGLLNSFNISFGPGARRSFNETYKKAKARHGIVTSLPMSELPIAARPPKPRPVPNPPSKEFTAEVLRVILGLIDPLCKQHLNDEYAVACHQLTEMLGRKRPSPLLSGSPNTWASGIVRTIGWVNFLHDKSQTPYMRLSDIDAHFGISASTGAAKLAAIRKMLRIHQLDPKWTLPSRLDNNPLAWMFDVNGFIMDVRHAPRDVQEIAFRKGLIPYVPADRRQAQE